MSKRKPPVGRAGNYAQEVDPSGMDDSMKESLGLKGGSEMDKWRRVNSDRSRRGLKPLPKPGSSATRK